MNQLQSKAWKMIIDTINKTEPLNNSSTEFNCNSLLHQMPVMDNNPLEENSESIVTPKADVETLGASSTTLDCQQLLHDIANNSVSIACFSVHDHRNSEDTSHKTVKLENESIAIKSGEITNITKKVRFSEELPEDLDCDRNKDSLHNYKNYVLERENLQFKEKSNDMIIFQRCETKKYFFVMLRTSLNVSSAWEDGTTATSSELMEQIYLVHQNDTPSMASEIDDITCQLEESALVKIDRIISKKKPNTKDGHANRIKSEKITLNNKFKYFNAKGDVTEKEKSAKIPTLDNSNKSVCGGSGRSNKKKVLQYENIRFGDKVSSVVIFAK